MRLTASTIRSLALPPGQNDKTFWDDDVPGFGVRIRAGGSRTWVIQYKIGGKHRRLPLGLVAALDPGKARTTAKDLLTAVRLGRDPAGEKLERKQKIAETFGALLPRYLTWQRSRLKPRSYEEVERHLVAHAKPLHTRAIGQIDRRAIAVRLGEIAESSGPSAANSVRRSLSAYFTWLLREGIIEANPVLNTNQAEEGGPRQRLLTDAELASIWHALGADQYSSILKLLVLTGARRNEIGGLRWSEIDFNHAVVTLPPERTKNRREFCIPLVPAALAILKVQPRRLRSDGSPCDFVFGHGDRVWQSWSQSKLELDRRIAARSEAIKDWRLHDFRRLISTIMHERLAVMPHIIEACLNHVSGYKAGIAGIYNVAKYDELKRIALHKWADHVETLITGKRTAAVMKLPRRRTAS
jgi:integrase